MEIRGEMEISMEENAISFYEVLTLNACAWIYTGGFSGTSFPRCTKKELLKDRREWKRREMEDSGTYTNVDLHRARAISRA